jgi:peroxiredoxin
VIAASVDTLENTQVMIEKSGTSFDFAYGVTQAEAETFGAWWSEDRGGYIQPAEFLISRGGVVLGSMYASGPVGRMGADEALRQITNRERRRHESEAH